MGHADAIGEAVTGGLMAGAIEPAAGGAAGDGDAAAGACLNCGGALVGPYCHQCGQAAHVHRTLSAFFHDLLHGVFHFEGKIWRTIPMLAWRPGELTRRYIEGQRASFVSPMALFLFSVFVMFAAVSSVGVVHTADSVKTEMMADARRNEVRIADAQKQRAAALAAGQPTAALDARIKDLQESVGVSRTIGEKGVLAGTALRISDDTPAVIREPLRAAVQNPDLFLYKLKSSAYKYSWALIPFSMPFLWLLFPFSRRFRLYDHMVFVTYSLCFMSLLATVVTLWSAAGLPGASLSFFVPPAHMYRQLRGAYGLGRAGAAWRAAVLAIVAIIVMALFSTALIALGLFD